MTYILGLTGSIGMGKSTTAAMFIQAGVPVWDADQAVHRLYTKDAEAIAAVAALFPTALIDGVISRPALSDVLKDDPPQLEALTAIIHPRVAADREAFIKAHSDKTLIVLDIPLLFETGRETEFDGVLVVTTDAETQKARVMARAGMTDEWFNMILLKQMPDAEKRARADFIIETKTIDHARDAVENLIKELTDA